MFLKKIRNKNKKAVSPVIATILLILLAVTAIVIIAGIVIPFVRDNLDESKKCFEAADQLMIDTESGYTCYYEDDGEMIANITIKKGVKETEIERFKISVFGGGSSDSFDIKTGEPGVKMLDGSSDDIKIPDLGEEKTYSLTTDLTIIESAEVYPVMNSGKLCDATDRADIEACEI